MIAAHPAPTPPDIAPIADDALPSELTCWDLVGNLALWKYVRELRAWVAEVSSACGSVPP